MNKILQYFNMCIIFNIFTACVFLSINHTQVLTQRIFSSLEFLSFLNITKIIIQLRITRYIRERLFYKKHINIDRFLDLAKIAFSTYMIIDFDKFFINSKMYIIFGIIVINYFVIFLQFIYNLISPNLFRPEIPQTIFLTSQPETRIAFNNYNVYTVSDTNNSICPICLDEKLTNEEWAKLVCNHEFHNKCITCWVSKKRTCPICRINI